VTQAVSEVSVRGVTLLGNLILSWGGRLGQNFDNVRSRMVWRIFQRAYQAIMGTVLFLVKAFLPPSPEVAGKARQDRGKTSPNTTSSFLAQEFRVKWRCEPLVVGAKTIEHENQATVPLIGASVLPN
jgi:hypothetical protein